MYTIVCGHYFILIFGIFHYFCYNFLIMIWIHLASHNNINNLQKEELSFILMNFIIISSQEMILYFFSLFFLLFIILFSLCSLSLFLCLIQLIIILFLSFFLLPSQMIGTSQGSMRSSLEQLSHHSYQSYKKT